MFYNSKRKLTYACQFFLHFSGCLTKPKGWYRYTPSHHPFPCWKRKTYTNDPLNSEPGQHERLWLYPWLEHKSPPGLPLSALLHSVGCYGYAHLMNCACDTFPVLMWFGNNLTKLRLSNRIPAPNPKRGDEQELPQWLPAVLSDWRQPGERSYRRTHEKESILSCLKFREF